jgi:hypothetical protein
LDPMVSGGVSRKIYFFLVVTATILSVDALRTSSVLFRVAHSKEGTIQECGKCQKSHKTPRSRVLHNGP